MQNKLVIISFIFLMVTVPLTNAQKLINSPYSRFNLGSLNPSGSFKSISMGGVGIAMKDNNAIFFNNPASYCSYDTTSFIFDFGLDGSKNTLSNGLIKYSSKDVNFHHLLMGFPVGRRWGVATGLVPVSNAYYYMSESTVKGGLGYDSIIGPLASVHKGGGSINNFFLGTGGNITKNISVGINMTVVFGQIDRLIQYEFEDYSTTFAQRATQKLRINGINFDYGIQYTKQLKKNHYITAGFSMTAAKKIGSSFEEINERFSVFASAPYSPDTVAGGYSYYHSKDSTRFPTTMRFGLLFGKKDKFVAEIDYVATSWSKARIVGSKGTLADTKSLMIGMEYIPDKNSNTSYLKRVEYRAGAHIADNYLVLNGVQLKEFGVSAGLGFRLSKPGPVGNPVSRANFYVDFTRIKGDIAKGLHNENVFSFGASLNLYDWWFIKRRYD